MIIRFLARRSTLVRRLLKEAVPDEGDDPLYLAALR